MKYGCFSLDFRRFSLETAFRIASVYGFDGIELWGGRPHAYPPDMDDDEIKRIKALRKKYRLDIPMYTPNALNMPVNLCSLDSREQEDAIAYFRKAILACEKLEIPRMLLVADHPGYEVPLKDAKNRFVENMRLLASFAKKHHVIPVLEPLTPMESPVITTVDDCVEMIDAIGDAHVEGMLDVVPPHIAYEPYSAYFEKLGKRLHYIHLCNNDDKTDAHLRLDTGCLPVEDMVEVFKKHGYKDYITVELYSENYSDPELMMANASRMIKRFREAEKKRPAGRGR